MILITKEEFEKLEKIMGDRMPHVAVTNRHKNGARKKRYIEENRRVLKLLKSMRAHEDSKGG